MKTELLKKIKKHEKSFQHENDTDHCIQPDDFNTVETLAISDCGICCSELSEYLKTFFSSVNLLNECSLLFPACLGKTCQWKQDHVQDLETSIKPSIHKYVESLTKTSNNNVV